MKLNLRGVQATPVEPPSKKPMQLRRCRFQKEGHCIMKLATNTHGLHLAAGEWSRRSWWAEPLDGGKRGRELNRKRKFLLIFTVIHALASMFTFVESFALGMARFDTGAEAGAAGTVLLYAGQALLFPLVTFIFGLEGAGSFFPGLLGWLPVLANSLFWAFVAWWLYSAIRRSYRGSEDSTAV